MQRKTHLFLFLLCFNCCIINIHAQQKRVVGSWSGELNLPGAKLQMLFHISGNNNKELNAKLDVPQQGAIGLPTGEVILLSDSLFIQVPSIMGTYEGKLISADSINGQWLQAGQSFVLNLKRQEHTPEIKRPQTPKPPFSYSSTEVEYINPKSGFKIAGTLTLPQNAINCPGVVLITGSGAQDRDETIFEHKPFWVIADYFTKHGIAVLRVDDRGVGGSEGSTSDACSADFATDVKTGLNYLKTREEINPNEIGLLGHSEGGMIAPIIASQSEDVAFIIMMAGLGIRGDSLLLAQTELIARTSGMSEQQINAQLFLINGIINILKKETEPEKRTENLRNAITGGMYKQMDADRQKMIDAQLRKYDNNWFSYFIRYNPQPDLLKVQCPVLALNGEKDLQVPAQSNLPAIEKALKEGGNSNFKTIELPHLNHLFQNCETGLPNEYAQIEETISPNVLQMMKNWILEITEE